MTLTRYETPVVAELVREYLSSTELPCCVNCGEEVGFTLDYGDPSGARFEVRCSGCSAEGSWNSPLQESAWESLQLAYLAECVRAGRPPRCPADDCRVNHAEFEGGVLEFRCPYCGRKGRLEAVSESDSSALHSPQNESIVFLTG